MVTIIIFLFGACMFSTVFHFLYIMGAMDEDGYPPKKKKRRRGFIRMVISAFMCAVFLGLLNDYNNGLIELNWW